MNSAGIGFVALSSLPIVIAVLALYARHGGFSQHRIQYLVFRPAKLLTPVRFYCAIVWWPVLGLYWIIVAITRWPQVRIPTWVVGLIIVLLAGILVVYTANLVAELRAQQRDQMSAARMR